MICFLLPSAYLIFESVIIAATVDVKRNIFDLCTDSADCYLAVIEVSCLHHTDSPYQLRTRCHNTTNK